MVFISSTGVYGAGKDLPYCETDICSPTTVHHQVKHEAEEIVLQANQSNLVIRTGWLFGGEAENRKNFVARRIEEAISAKADGRVLKSNAQQFGVPSYCDDVAARILTLAKMEACGVFNCVNFGSASRFEYVKAIIDAAMIPVNVEAADAQTFNRKAPVSNNEMAENRRMMELGLAQMPAWQDSLASYVSKLTSEMEFKSDRS
jgi:dTDP-4-dehydrorhamnose reductase